MRPLWIPRQRRSRRRAAWCGAAATAASRSRSSTGPRYDDWSFPKGKLDKGESWEDGALREVEEEIGLRCRLGHELPHTSYRDPKGRAKVVRYWMMEPLDGEFAPSHEVDEMRWVPTSEAGRLLSYEHDRELLRQVTG